MQNATSLLVKKHGKRGLGNPSPLHDSFLLERILAQAADRAYPILRHIFPGCAGGYAVVGIANCGVVHIAAGAYILIHSKNLSFLFFVEQPADKIPGSVQIYLGLYGLGQLFQLLFRNIKAQQLFQRGYGLLEKALLHCFVVFELLRQFLNLFLNDLWLT